MRRCHLKKERDVTISKGAVKIGKGVTGEGDQSWQGRITGESPEHRAQAPGEGCLDVGDGGQGVDWITRSYFVEGLRGRRQGAIPLICRRDAGRIFCRKKETQEKGGWDLTHKKKGSNGIREKHHQEKTRSEREKRVIL